MSKQTDLINIPDAITVSGSSVGIGTTSPLSTMHLSTTGGGSVYLQDSNATSTYNISEISNNAGNFGIQTRNSSGTFVSTDYQIVKNASGADYHRWFTQGTERMRIDSSGNVLVGKASADNTTDGATLFNDGTMSFTANLTNPAGGRVAVLNRRGSDGEIVSFRKDGTTVGSIGSNGTASWIACPAGSGAGLRFDGSDNRIVPTEGDGTNRNAAVDLGYSSSRFKDAYLSGGIYLGGVGSANKLEDYEEGTWTPTVTVGAVSSSSGSYTKVGRLVTVNAYMGGFSNTVNNEVLIVSNLPFTGGVTGRAGGSAMWSGVDKDFAYEVTYYDGSSQFRFYHTTNQSFDSIRHIDLDGSGTEVYFTATYMSA